MGSIPESGRSPVDNGNTLQYSCQENSMDREAWQAAVHGVTGSANLTVQTAPLISKKDDSIANLNAWFGKKKKKKTNTKTYHPSSIFSIKDFESNK